MKAFEYATPSTIEEAVSLLSDRWGESEILAGGTDLVTSMKQGITSPNRIVSLKKVDLRGISHGDGKVVVGAMTPMGELAHDPTVRERFPSLARAAENIGGSQLLSVGTVGGDLCQRPRCWYFRNGFGLLAQKDGKSLVASGDNRYHAIFGNEGPAKFVSASSLGPALIALGATIVTSARSLPAKEFFTTPQSEEERETALKPNEILTAIEVPANDRRNATYEIRHRKGLDWPYVTASVAYRNGSGGATDAIVVLGHVAPVPWEASQAASKVDGGALSMERVAEAGVAASQGASPLSGNAYKVKMVETAVKRALLIAAGMQAAM